MKTIILSIFILLSTIVPLSNTMVEESESEFLNQCQEGYSSYTIITTEETEKYFLTIVIGEIDKQIGYSIFFYSQEPKEYKIIFTDNKQTKYTLDENSRGDIIVHNLQIKADYCLEVQNNNITTNSIEVNNIDYETYVNQYTTIINQGQNIGFKKKELNKVNIFSLTIILCIIFITIIVVGIIILLVLFINKKGLFNEDKINEEFMEEHQIKSSIENYIYNNPKNNEIEAEEVEVVNEIKNEVYEKNQRYEDEEPRDVSLLLIQKGFNTNYQELNTEEKNIIMVELMKMKQFQEITEEEYRTEIIKLWM